MSSEQQSRLTCYVVDIVFRTDRNINSLKRGYIRVNHYPPNRRKLTEIVWTNSASSSKQLVDLKPVQTATTEQIRVKIVAQRKWSCECGEKLVNLAAYLEGGPAIASVGTLTLRAGLAHRSIGPSSNYLQHSTHNIG